MRRQDQAHVRVYRVSVPCDSLTHARLRALASLRGVDASAIASAILRQGLGKVLVRDMGPENGTAPPDQSDLAGS